jgi:hypothetical protein
VLGLTLAFAVVFFTNRECQSDCPWVADAFFEGNGVYFLLAACWVVAAALAWALSQPDRPRLSGKYALGAAAVGASSELVNVAMDDKASFHVIDAAVIGAAVLAVAIVLGAVGNAMWPEGQDAHADP